MKHIASIDEYYTIITTEPRSILIFGSIKTCHPCRQLKKWIEEDHSTLSNIYEIDVFDPEFESVTNDIDCLPTTILYNYTEEQSRIEGFNKVDFLAMIEKINNEPFITNPPLTLL